MLKYIISIKPEFRQSFTPDLLLDALEKLNDLTVVEGLGKRTVTVSSSRDILDDLSRELPQVTIREYEPLELLAGHPQAGQDSRRRCQL